MRTKSDWFRELRHAELGSTNDEASRLLSSAAIEPPLIVRADRQVAGRGRGANLWWSDAGSLTFTLGIDPAAHGLRTEHTPRVALVVGLALIEAVGPLVSNDVLCIRWPNDVEAGGRKLAGILPELIATDRGARLLVGIGLNVTTDLSQAPEAVRSMATSVQELAGHPVEIELVYASVLERIAAILPELARNDPGLPGRWASRDGLLDQPVRIVLGDRVLEGTARGIEPQGGLRVETALGITVLYGGQVLR